MSRHDDGRDPDGSAAPYGRGSAVSAAWLWLTALVDQEDDWQCWSGMTRSLCACRVAGMFAAWLASSSSSPHCDKH